MAMETMDSLLVKYVEKDISAQESFLESTEESHVFTRIFAATRAATDVIARAWIFRHLCSLLQT
eukprot:SAG22_NODE_1039_length_5888_cov_4.141302_2_plen_64_part_00